MVVNTQSSNLPGEHWLAIYFTDDEIKVFDPMGFYYPPVLVNQLNKVGKNVEYNTIQYQSFGTKTCGKHCLIWLKIIKNSVKFVVC